MVNSTTEVLETNVYTNLSADELVQAALARGEGELASNRALVVKTGARTGRSPKDRFIVRDDITDKQVDWNNINQPLAPEKFTRLWEKATDYLAKKNTKFVSYLRVGQHPQLGVPVKVISELAWQNLFANVLFIRPEKPQHDQPDQWTILSVPGLQAAGAQDGVNSDAAVILNFGEKKILICGTYYAGEIKKAMFSVLNFLLPAHDILPMHCAANVGEEGDTALFFGLSGTGKTTLSADPDRFLIGDDEHGWGKDGVFNFEGGCYAKCIDLSQEREPLIWNAIRSGSVIENVVLNENKEPDYGDASLTQNTRAAYPREFIPQRVESNTGIQPHVVLFLTCDLYGVLPPVARLTEEQAAYYFLSGYTALVGSTEVGNAGNEIKPTFSTCFGAPFFPRAPSVYADLLVKRLQNYETEVYLVNTGWSGGAHGDGGKRFSIPTTRAVVSAIVHGKLKNAKYTQLPGFNIAIPTEVDGVEAKLLDPRKAWADQSAYRNYTRTLIQKFNENFQRFQVKDAIRDAGPKLSDVK